MSNPFVLPAASYVRDIDPLKQATEQYTQYLHKRTGKPYAECREFVVRNFKAGGKFEFKDPQVYYLERKESGDREKTYGTLKNFIYDSLNKRQLIAPNLTTYLSHAEKEAYLVPFIDGNVKARSVAKKAMFRYGQEGNKTMETIKKNEQNNRKIKNNSISGAHVSPSTPLFNPTSHSTLTSNCRTTSGYGNANNEKFLNGNRHYWSPEIVRANIISVTTNVNHDRIGEVISKYGLAVPSAEAVMDCITYSTNLYWRDPTELKSIRELVKMLNDIERAAFVYVGDFYHLMRHNEKFVYDFLNELTDKKSYAGDDFMAVLKSVPEDDVALAAQICTAECKGKKRDSLTDEENRSLSGTSKNVNDVIHKYADLIAAFWVTPNVPASLARLPESIRRCAITSDTDSTIFTVQDWVLWHRGRYGFSQDCINIAAAVVYLAAQTITHVLAIVSANFGIPTERIHQVAMKNEFRFDVFVPTQVAKHYFAIIGAQEGNIFGEFKEEIKGVHLRSSNIATELIGGAKKLMRDIMDTVVAEKQVEAMPILKQVADVERDIYAALKKGDPRFFRRAQVKTSDSYTRGEQEPSYMSYLLWEEVFAEKYGSTPPPPFSGVKLSCNTAKPGVMKEWLEGLEDRALAARFEQWLERNGKKGLGTVIVPETVVTSTGIPDELLQAVGSRELIRNGCKAYYLVLECLGIYLENKKITKLVSDYY